MLPEQQQRIMGYFIEEAKDHLNTIEQGLLSLQATIEDSEKANEIFRAAHSVKGGAAMLGLESIQKTAHRMEDYFKVLKEATVRVDHTLETMFLRISDGLKDLLEQLEGPFGLTPEKAQEIMAGVDPVFEQLETHLNKLVAQAENGAVASESTGNDRNTSARETSFKQDVAALLRELLTTFKQPDTAETRKSIQNTCFQLIGIGEQFKLAEWCDLIETARLAAANEANEYRTLAPILIKEIKRSQDLVLADRASEVAVSEAMQSLLPEDILVVSGVSDTTVSSISASSTTAVDSEHEPSQEDNLFEDDSLFDGDSLFEAGDLFETEAQLEEGDLFEDNLFENEASSEQENDDFDDLFSPEVDTDVDTISFTSAEETASATELSTDSNINLTVDSSDTDAEPEEAPIGRLNIDLDFNEIPSELSALNRNSESEEKADESLDALLATVNVTGPDVGTDELNSLADLFDGDLEELDNTLGGHPFVSEEMRLHPEKIDLDEEDDLTDLLGSEIADGLSQEGVDSDNDIDDDLFGGTLTDGGFATGNDLDFDLSGQTEESSPDSEQIESSSDTNDELGSVTEDVWGSNDDDALFGMETDDLFAIETGISETIQPETTQPETNKQEAQTENYDDIENLATPESEKLSIDSLLEIETTDHDTAKTEEEVTDAGDEEDYGFTDAPAVSLFSEEHISPSEDEIEFPTLTGIKLEEAEKDIDSFFLGDDDEAFLTDDSEEDFSAELFNPEPANTEPANTEPANTELFNPEPADTEPLLKTTLDDLREDAVSETAVSEVSQISDDPWGELSGEQEEEEAKAESRSSSVEQTSSIIDLSDDFLSVESDLSFNMNLNVEQAGSELEDLLAGADEPNIAATKDNTTENDLWGELGTTEEPSLAIELDMSSDSNPIEQPSQEDDETHFSDDFIQIETDDDKELLEIVADDLEADHIEGDEAITTFSNLLPSEIDALVENKEDINNLDSSDESNLFETDLFEENLFEENVLKEIAVEENFLNQEDSSTEDETPEKNSSESSLDDIFKDSSTAEVDLEEAESDELENLLDNAFLDEGEAPGAEIEAEDKATDTLTEGSLNKDDFLANDDFSANVEADIENVEIEADSLDMLLEDDFLSTSSDTEDEPEASGDSFESLESLLGEDVEQNTNEEDSVLGLSADVQQDEHRVEESTESKNEDAEDQQSDSSDDEDFGDLERLLDDGDADGTPPTMSRRVSPRTARRSNTGVREQNMRVPVKHLDNLSNLVGELVVSRNTLESDQERLRQFLDNLLFQVQQLNDVGQRMRDLYERSLLESSLVSNRRAHAVAQSSKPSPEAEGHATGATFDALEMDRFTGFHTLSQEMIELIVRVRESSSDIGYTVESSDQVTRQFRQITTQLQEGLNTARMVAFSQAADRLPRAVRDISIKCGKQARLVIEGKDTLIDKMIVEHLYDPLTHLVNNAITHGIEKPEARQAAGKAAEGTITVQAFYQGNQTVIYVADDGGGINPDFVKRKAIEKSLLTQSEADALSDIEAYALIFHAGFSTRDQADDFAGRGVGMDVVQTSLAEIRGAITIDSELGKGTSFTIRLPLTLSISKALSCVSNQARIAFPMDGVEDMLDVPRDRVVQNEQGQDCVRWRDGLLPFQGVTELLKFNRTLGRGRVYGGSQDDDVLSIIVLRSANTFVAVQVDQVIGEEEIVIKQLEGPVPKPLGIAGATILGDGRVMPIADVLELIDIAMGRIRREPASMLWAETPIEEAPVKSDPTVLIVDDSITVRELLSMSFNKVGYRVEQARDGQEAWDKLRSGLPCDLVFCDIEMPRMDGLELLSRMQKDSQLKHVPIAMLTSRGADRHRQMAVDLGASGYFTKPYLEEALLDAAQRMLNGESLTKGRGG